jgi:hypothetical protein
MLRAKFVEYEELTSYLKQYHEHIYTEQWCKQTGVPFLSVDTGLHFLILWSKMEATVNNKAVTKIVERAENCDLYNDLYRKCVQNVAYPPNMVMNFI